MIGFAAKKLYRDERLVQLLFILSILRGSPERAMLRDQNDFHQHSVLDDAFTENGRNFDTPFEPYHKTMDALLAQREEFILNDIQSLGDFVHQPQNVDIQAYLLNAEATVQNMVMPDPPVEEPDAFREAHDEMTTDEPLLPIDFQDMEYFLPPHEELEMVEALWKQDIDIGIPREAFDEDEEFQKEDLDKIDAFFNIELTKDKDPSADPDGSMTENIQNDKVWVGGNFTIDSETGELLANDTESEIDSRSLNLDTAPSLALDSNVNSGFDLDFNLDDALRLVQLQSEEPSDVTKANEDDCSDDSAFGEGSLSPSSDLDGINASIDEMIQTPHFNSRNVQGRLGGLARGGSMDQRWQDLASLLSLPSPDAHHAQSPPTSSMAAHGTSPVHTHAHGPPVHHPHPLYPSHDGNVPSRSVLLHNATLPPPMPEHSAHNITYSNSMGASSHLVTSSMNLTNNAELSVPGSDHSYKMENSSISSDMIYYQQQQQQQNSTQDIAQPNDGIWSSILNEEDLQLMDITMNDYNGRNSSEYNGGNYRYSGQEGPHRHPQKKQDIFTKRYFQENPNEASNNIVPNNTNIGGATVGTSPLVQGYQSHYPSTTGVTPMEGATALDPSELKYSCTMDFRSPTDVGATTLDHVQHNHTYHMSPEGPSGISRPIAKDKKGKKSESEKHLSRDEKKARSLNLPISCEDIINLPMDEFNERISKFDLTEAQLSLIRDIRRRGKNKVAAQNCRKRKLDQITHLAEEVKVYQYRKTELRSQLEHFTSEKARVKHKFSLLYRHIFNSLRDPDGNPYCPHEFSLQQSADGDILLVPRAAPHPSMDHLSKARNSKEEPSP